MLNLTPKLWQPVVAAVVMTVLTGIAWYQVRVSEQATLQFQLRGSISGFAAAVETEYDAIANGVARKASRAAYSGVISVEQWEFEAQSLRSDVPSMKLFSFIDQNYKARWILMDDERVDPNANNSPARKTPASQAFLERLVAENERVGNLFYTSSAGKSLMLVQAPISKDGELKGFVGGAFDIEELIAGQQKKYSTRIALALTHNGRSVYRTNTDTAPLSLDSKVSVPVDLGGVKFVLEGLPTQAFVDSGSRALSNTTGLVGFLFMIIVTGLMHQRSVIARNTSIVQRQAWALSQSKDAMIIHNQAHGILDCSQGAVEMFGYSKPELLGMKSRDLVDPKFDYEHLIKDRGLALANGRTWTATVPCLTKAGKRRLISVTDSLLRDSQGKEIGFVSMSRDVTDLEQQGERLAESERRFRRLFESGRDGVVIRQEGEESTSGITLANQAFCNLVGYTLEELKSLPTGTLVKDPVSNSRLAEARDQLRTQGYATPVDLIYARKDGHAVIVSVQMWRIYNDANEHEQTIVTYRDISVEKRSAALLASSESRFRGLFESSRDGILIREVTSKGRTQIVDANQAYLDLIGYTFDEALHLEGEEVVPSAEDQAAILYAREQVEEHGYCDPFSIQCCHSSGHLVPVICSIWRTYDDDGQHKQTITTFRDVSKSKETEERLAEAQRIAQLGSWEEDLKTGARSWSKEMYRIYEHDPSQPPYTNEQILQAVHPDDREELRLGYLLAKPEERKVHGEHRLQMPDGRVKVVQFQYTAMLRDGKHTGKYAGTLQDITEQRRLEDQLRHTQNLHTVGQLTGGIAHDFNNILGVISSNVQYLEMMAGDQTEVADTARRVQTAVQRGAHLTDQMLSFSRKQSLEPRDIAARPFLEDLKETVSRGLGEEVSIVLDIENEPWGIVADESQLSNAILNLALNGRDAMGGRGQLTISVRNELIENLEDEDDAPDLTPGSYVAVTVSDKGAGMSAETAAKVFEPFFTTKEVGEGTGLGLSMVYGFADQSGGTVTIKSTVDVGTSVTIYLPGTQSGGGEPQLNLNEESSTPISIKTILLVEDQEDLREINEQILRKLGHRVLTAENGQQALEIAQKSGRIIDAAFLDIVLPDGMNGIDLAGSLRDTNPELRILFTTGYASKDLLAQLEGVEHDGLFRKPIQMKEISSRLSEIFSQHLSESSSVA